MLGGNFWLSATSLSPEHMGLDQEAAKHSLRVHWGEARRGQC